MAPSVNSPLTPIVIPEIAVAPHFTCLGSGLLQNGHPRESPSSLQALLLPSAAVPRGIPNSAKPKTWWRAQCLHYGIDMPVSATIERMRARLEDALRSSEGLVLPADLLDLEHKKCGEFRKLNAQVRDKVSGGDSAPGKAKAKPKPKPKPKPTPKNEPKEMITTTTITTTTTTKRENTAVSSRGGSGAGAAKAAKTAKNAKVGSVSRSAPMKTSGVSKPKPVVKPKGVKKEVKKEEDDGLYNYPHPSREETLRQQQEFRNSTNYTSPQGPLPSYLSQNQPRPTWQTQAAPNPEYERPRSTARYSGPPRGGGNASSSSGRPRWIPQGDGTFKQFGAPIGGGYRHGGGRSVSSTHQNHYPQPRQRRSELEEEEAPPPAYGSWLQNDNGDMRGSNSDYPDGAEFTATRYEEEEDGLNGNDGYGDDSEMEDIIDDIVQSAEMQEHEDEYQAEMELERAVEGANSNAPWENHNPGSESEQSDTTLDSYHSEHLEARNPHRASSENWENEFEEDYSSYSDNSDSDSNISVWGAEASVQIY